MRDDALDSGHVDSRRLARRGVAGRLDAQHGARLVQDVERAVRQAVVAQMAAREARGALDRAAAEADLVVLLVACLEPAQDQHGVLEVGLVDQDLLHAAVKRVVLLDLLELLEGRRADQTHLPLGEQGLDEIGQVHRPTRDRPCADHGVHLVDEQDRFRPFLQLGDHCLEALLEIAAESRPGQ
jgi:hypothetical protein